MFGFVWKRRKACSKTRSPDSGWYYAIEFSVMKEILYKSVMSNSIVSSLQSHVTNAAILDSSGLDPKEGRKGGIP